VTVPTSKLALAPNFDLGELLGAQATLSGRYDVKTAPTCSTAPGPAVCRSVLIQPIRLGPRREACPFSWTGGGHKQRAARESRPFRAYRSCSIRSEQFVAFALSPKLMLWRYLMPSSAMSSRPCVTLVLQFVHVDIHAVERLVRSVMMPALSRVLMRTRKMLADCFMPSRGLRR